MVRKWPGEESLPFSLTPDTCPAKPAGAPGCGKSRLRGRGAQYSPIRRRGRNPGMCRAALFFFFLFAPQGQPKSLTFTIHQKLGGRFGLERFLKITWFNFLNLGMRKQRTKEAAQWPCWEEGSQAASSPAGCQGVTWFLQLSGVVLGYAPDQTKGSITRLPSAHGADYVFRSWGSCQLFWQTQTPSKETGWLHGLIVTSFFLEPARDRRYFQLKDGGICPLNMWTHRQSCVGSCGSGTITSLDFWFKVVHSMGSLFTWRVRGFKFWEGLQGHPRSTWGSLVQLLEKQDEMDLPPSPNSSLAPHLTQASGLPQTLTLKWAVLRQFMKSAEKVVGSSLPFL